MQINRGIYRGLKLNTLDGDNTRPTSSKVREAMFNMLMTNVYGARVLDLFAGSGALAIESISSNASFVDINDNNNEAIKVIKSNLAKIKHDNFVLYNLDYNEYIRKCNQVYDIVFLDPPYHLELINSLVISLVDNDLINEDGIIVCESKVDENIMESYKDLVKYKEKKYGTIKISMFRRE